MNQQSTIGEREMKLPHHTFSELPNASRIISETLQVPPLPENTHPEIPKLFPIHENTIKSAEISQTLPIEKDENFFDKAIAHLKQTLRTPKKQKPTTIPHIKDELTRSIEKLMEDGLTDAYKELTPIQQQEFKIKGEETAWKIKEALTRTKIKIKEIFKLLVEWLQMLPGVNRFFVEQEAKIKADKIISLKKYNDQLRDL